MKEPYRRARGKEPACSAGDTDWIPGLGRSPGGEHGNLLQDSCLENPHGQRSLAGATVHEITQRSGHHWSDLAHKGPFPLAVTAMGQDLTTLRISTFRTISSSLFFIAYHPSWIPKISENAKFPINTVFVGWISPWMCALFLCLSPVKSNRQIGLRKALNWPQYLEQ